MDLIAVGDVMVDVHVQAPALKRGGDVHGRVRLQPAGTSANAAVWAAWDGAEVRVHGRVGDDLAGRLLRDALAERGVDPALTVDADAPSGTMLVVVEAGERSMVADRGANALFTPEDLPTSLDAGAVLVSGYLLLQEPTTPAGLAAIDRATATFVGVEASSWPLVEAFGSRRFLSESTGAGANVLFANEREAEFLVGLSGTAAARALGERYRVACVKLGEKGAAMSFEGSLVEVAAEPVVEVDATGAGDAFDGVLLVALARGEQPEAALRRACHAGALVAASADTWPELDT
ncbi:MAG: carbohydrate kinase family protein [Actinomycetota bacterium]